MNILNSLNQIPTWVIFLIYLWSVVWKGLSLWRASQLKQRNWFIGILLLNSLGILEILYLFFFANKKLKLGELKFWETK